MKKLLLALFFIGILLQSFGQLIEVVGQESRSTYESKSYEVIQSLKLLPGFRASRADNGRFFARMNGFEVYPEPYSYASAADLIKVSLLGKVPELIDIENHIQIFGTRSGKIDGIWSLIGEEATFNPSSDFIIGESVTVFISKDLTIQGSSDFYLTNSFEWIFKVSPETTADSPVNFSLAQNLVPLTNPATDPSSILLDINNDGVAGILVYDSPPRYYQNNGSSFQEIPTNFPEIQPSSIFSPAAKVIGHLDVDNDGDSDLIFNRAKQIAPGFSVGTEEIVILQNNNLDFTNEFFTFDLNGTFERIIVHDIDKDGIQDFLIKHHSQSFEDYITTFLSSDNFQAPVVTLITDRRNGLELVDINSDGVFEILIGENIYSLEEDGSVNFIVGTNVNWARLIAVDDIDENGLPDLIVAQNDQLYLSKNDGSFEPKESLYTSSEFGTPSFINDFDGDQKTDALILDQDQTVFSSLPLSTNSYSSEGMNSWNDFHSSNSNHFFDVDLDGDIDLITFGWPNGLSWYENSSNEVELLSFTVDNPVGINTNIDHANKIIEISLSDISADLSNSTISFLISEDASLDLNGQNVATGSIVELFDFNQIQVIAEDQKTTSDWEVIVLRPTFDLVVGNQNSRILTTDQIPFSFSEGVLVADLSSYAIVRGDLSGEISGSWTQGVSATEALFTPNSDFLFGEKLSISFPKEIRNSLSSKNLSPKNIQLKVNSGISYKNPPQFSDIRSTNQGGYRKQIPYDFDGDGDLDLILHRRNSSNLSEILVSYFDNGQFNSPQTVVSINESVYEIHTPHDFDGDGSLDYLYTSITNQSEKLVVHGIIELTASHSNFRSNVEIGDIDGNGISDIIYGRGAFLEIVTLDRPEPLQNLVIETSGTIKAIDVYDYDYDGDLDILFTRGVDIEVYTNEGNNQFTLNNLNVDHGSLNGISSINKIIASDTDNDGDIDFILGGSGYSDYLVESTGSGYSYSLLKENNYNFEPHLFDITGNDTEEVVFSPYEWASLSNPAVLITHEQIAAGFSGGEKMLFADLDNDADIDILTSNGWFENFSSSAQIIGFELTNQVGDATIGVAVSNFGGGSINVKVHPTVDLQTEDLVATFTLSDGATADISNAPQVSGTTANNFQNNVFYTITAEDGYTERVFNVNVSNATFNILSLSPFQNESGVSENQAISILLEEELSATSDLNNINVNGDLSGTINGFWSSTAETITFSPASPYLPGENITVQIPDKIILNVDENSFLNGAEIRFKVGVGSSESNPAYFESAPIFTSITGDIEGITPHDINNDDLIDFVVTHGGTSSLFINNGNRNFTEHSFGAISNIVSTTIGDWDKNANSNILLKSSGTTLYDYEFVGGSLNLVRTLTIEASISGQLDFYDWENDGTMDLVYNGDRIIINDLDNGLYLDQQFVDGSNFYFTDLSISGINKFNRLQFLHSDNNEIRESLDGTVLLPGFAKNGLDQLFTSQIRATVLDYTAIFPPSIETFYYKLDNVTEGNFTSDDNSGVLFRVIKDDNAGFSNPDSIFHWATAYNSFYSTNRTLPITNFEELEVGDINGDGLDDICFIYDGKLSWFESQNGSFVEHIITNSLQSPKNLILTDFDGDSDVDIVYSSLVSNERKLHTFENTTQPPAASPSLVESNIVLSSNSGVDLILYPNPASDYIELKGSLNNASVSILDLFGRTIKNYKNENSNSMTLDTSQIIDGLYVLSIELKNGELMESRIVIKH